MQILREIMGNSEGMFWYQMCSVCIGISLIICKDGQKIWYKVLIYSVCVANAFLWGSMLLFRLYFNQLSFLIGGLLVSVLNLLIFVIKKGCEKYFFCFWCQVKVFLLVGNYLIEHYSEEQEEIIFGISISVASLFFLFFLIASFYRFKKEKSININGICRGMGVIYGSVLVTGCIYEFAHDVVLSNTKFLSVSADYINFYKTMFKVDWTEEGTGIFFAIVCASIIIFGTIYRNVFNVRND